MAVQKRNAEMVDLLRADFVHKLDTFYLYAPQVKKSVAAGDTFVIYSGYQYIVADSFDAIGTIDIMGELVII